MNWGGKKGWGTANDANEVKKKTTTTGERERELNTPKKETIP